MIDRDNPPTFATGAGKFGVKAYPMGGVKTAPAWRAMWAALVEAKGEWVCGVTLDEVGALAGRCSPKTAKLLLHRAAQRGVIEKDKTVESGRWQVRYRVPGTGDGSLPKLTEAARWARRGIDQSKPIEDQRDDD